MYYRRKILLALLKEFGGQLPHTDLQKLLFLLTKKQEKKSFEFIPYKFGCFSFQANQDLHTMKKKGILTEVREGTRVSWKLVSEEDYQAQIFRDDRIRLKSIHKHFRDFSTKELIRYTYLHFPYYAIKSEIASSVLSQRELESVSAEVPSVSDKRLFTIGYEGISFEKYLNRLVKNNIGLLCDVRKNPFSMKYGFSKKQLQNACLQLGIEYLHIPELGIVSDKRKNLNSYKDYTSLFEEYEQTTLIENRSYLEKIRDLFSTNTRIALTCFEKEPCMCHRERVATHLLRLPDWNIPLEHL